MAEQKMHVLINTLVEKTNRGELSWDTTDLDDVFQLTFSNNTIRLSLGRSPSNLSEEAYFINIYDSNGKLIDSINDEDLGDLFSNAFIQLRGLYQNARRTALGVDKAIDDILDELSLL